MKTLIALILFYVCMAGAQSNVTVQLAPAQIAVLNTLKSNETTESYFHKRIAADHLLALKEYREKQERSLIAKFRNATPEKRAQAMAVLD